eukprot:9398056-Pyramimonas_sp.AAC.1
MMMTDTTPSAAPPSRTRWAPRARHTYLRRELHPSPTCNNAVTGPGQGWHLPRASEQPGNSSWEPPRMR